MDRERLWLAGSSKEDASKEVTLRLRSREQGTTPMSR